MSYPVILLSSWILASILENVENRRFYVNDTAIKRFIHYRGANTCNIKYTPLVRILSFTGTTPGGELVALVNDSTHKIAVLFTREAIRKFETRYCQRLTFHSVHTLITIRQANLKFITGKTHPMFFRALGGITPSSLKGNSLLYLEVNELQFFLRDAHSVSASADKMLKFVYLEPEYQLKFMAGKARKSILSAPNVEGLNEESNGNISLLEISDEMLSEVEDEESSEIASNSQFAGTSSPKRITM